MAPSVARTALDGFLFLKDSAAPKYFLVFLDISCGPIRRIQVMITLADDLLFLLAEQVTKSPVHRLVLPVTILEIDKFRRGVQNGFQQHALLPHGFFGVLQLLHPVFQGERHVIKAFGQALDFVSGGFFVYNALSAGFDLGGIITGNAVGAKGSGQIPAAVVKISVRPALRIVALHDLPAILPQGGRGMSVQFPPHHLFRRLLQQLDPPGDGIGQNRPHNPGRQGHNAGNEKSEAEQTVDGRFHPGPEQADPDGTDPLLAYHHGSGIIIDQVFAGIEQTAAEGLMTLHRVGLFHFNGKAAPEGMDENLSLAPKDEPVGDVIVEAGGLVNQIFQDQKIDGQNGFHRPGRQIGGDGNSPVSVFLKKRLAHDPGNHEKNQHAEKKQQQEKTQIELAAQTGFQHELLSPQSRWMPICAARFLIGS